MASSTCVLSARFSLRVASERIYTRGWEMAFIRMRSPSRAPPDFFLLGSTLITATVRESDVCRNRLSISSVREDFPDPPVPVMPSTGVFAAIFSSRTGPVAGCGMDVSADSAAVMARAIRRMSMISPNGGWLSQAPEETILPFSAPAGPVIFSRQRCSTSSIMPSRPIERPSSGE